jgi:hypothetical protein
VGEPREQTTRRDSLGRRIGYNWWREFNMDCWSSAHAAWEMRRESNAPAYMAAGGAHSGAACHQLSDGEYRTLYPEPTLKEFLIGNKGMNDEPETEPPSHPNFCPIP